MHSAPDQATATPRLRVVHVPTASSVNVMPATIARKQLISRFIALLLLIHALPIIGLLALVVRMTSRGPGIYRQRRVGYQRREFVIFKIRTMRDDAEAATGPIWAATRDSREIFVGGLLRRLHLDELPQLINVVRGEMCLVGPRPERPEIIAKLEQQIPDYSERLAVPPGVAGLAQVWQGGDVNLESVKRKLAFDLAYIRRLRTDPFLDVRILLATTLMLLGPSRATAARLCGLNHAQLEVALKPQGHHIKSGANDRRWASLTEG